MKIKVLMGDGNQWTNESIGYIEIKKGYWDKWFLEQEKRLLTQGEHNLPTFDIYESMECGMSSKHLIEMIKFINL